jgi:hypothetical protein
MCMERCMAYNTLTCDRADSIRCGLRAEPELRSTHLCTKAVHEATGAVQAWEHRARCLGCAARYSYVQLCGAWYAIGKHRLTW